MRRVKIKEINTNGIVSIFIGQKFSGLKSHKYIQIDLKAIGLSLYLKVSARLCGHGGVMI